MRYDDQLGRAAVSAVATTAVIIGGAVVGVFVFSTGSQRPTASILVYGGILAGCVLLIWMLRDRPSNQPRVRLRDRFRRRRPTRREPRILVKRRHGDIEPDAANQPPTAEQLQDLKDHSSTWVPNRSGARDSERG